MLRFNKLAEHAPFNETVLVLGAPNGLGFVGQLAIDLMINSTKATKVGILDSPLITPFFSSTEDSQKCMAMEVYQTIGITYVLLRSNVIRGFGVEFAKQLSQWIFTNKFRTTLLITALDHSRRTDAQLDRFEVPADTFSHPFYYHGSRMTGLTQVKVDKLGWRPLAPYHDEFTTHPTHLPPGGGIARFLLEEFDNQKEAELLVCTWFTGEGDNSEVCHEFASKINELILVHKGSWEVPTSWSRLNGPGISAREIYQI